MKLCYTLILIFTEILIALTIFRIFYAKNENLALSQKIFDLLVVGFFTVFPNIFITHVTSEFMAMIFFSWYFCFIDILLFLLLYFSVEYAFPNASASRRWHEAFYVFFRYDVAAFFQKKKQRTTWFEKMMLAIFLLVVADIAQFVPNIFSHAVFSVESFYSEGGFFADFAAACSYVRKPLACIRLHEGKLFKSPLSRLAHTSLRGLRSHLQIYSYIISWKRKAGLR